MHKRLSFFMLAAAGTMLLTACGQAGQADPTTEGRDVSARSAKVNNVSGSIDSVDCGEADLEGLGYHNIWADQGAGGVVECDEAYDVIGEYLRIPLADRDAATSDLKDIQLSGGWFCGTDDTEVTSLYCYKGDAGNATEFTFHTVPAAETEPDPNDESIVNCGEFTVDENGPHTVIVDGIGEENLVVSCDEAFSVLTEYRQVPVEERDAATVSIPLSDGWACLADGDSPAGVGCSKGDIANFTGMFHTIPVSSDEPVDCGEVQVTDSIAHTLIAKPGAAGIVDCGEAVTIFDEYIAIPIEERDTGVGFDNIQVSDGWACGTYDGNSMSITCGKDKVAGKFGYYFQTEPV